MGVEFAASNMCFVVLERTDTVRVLAANRLSLEDTRSRTSVAAFQSALATTLHQHAIDLIAVKSKPERGRMMAGAAALKMEALLLAAARTDVEFISVPKVARAEALTNDLHGYLQTAVQTAMAALVQHE